MDHLHIAAAQVHARAGQVAANLARIERQAHAAALNGCTAVLFAETVLHAYVFTAANLALAEPAGSGPATGGVVALAVRHRIVIAAGFLERTAEGIHNSQLVAFPDGTWTVRRKTQLTGEERAAGLVPGDGRFAPVVVGGVPCAVVICADAGHPGLAAILRAQGVRFRLWATAGGDPALPPMHADELALPAGRERYARLRATVHVPAPFHDLGDGHDTGFAAANALGFDGARTHHMGHCMIAGADGAMLAQIPGTPVTEHQLDGMVHARVHA